MEKLQKTSVNKDFPPLRLYFDEIRELYEVLSKHCKEPVTIYTCGYKITDFDDLKKLSEEQTHEMNISCTNPYLELRLTKVYGELYIGDGSLESEGLSSRIENCLLKGKATYPVLFKSNWLSYVIVLPLLLGFMLDNKILITSGAVAWLSYFLFIIIWGWLHYRFVTQRYNTIIFKSRKEAPNFLQRNKDELIMLIVGTFIGVVITKIIDLILK
jgi:hypothetical protein